MWIIRPYKKKIDIETYQNHQEDQAADEAGYVRGSYGGEQIVF